MARLSFVISILIIVGILQSWTRRIWVSMAQSWALASLAALKFTYGAGSEIQKITKGVGSVGLWG